jgi:hypothetical protein
MLLWNTGLGFSWHIGEYFIFLNSVFLPKPAITVSGKINKFIFSFGRHVEIGRSENCGSNSLI